MFKSSTNSDIEYSNIDENTVNYKNNNNNKKKSNIFQEPFFYNQDEEIVFWGGGSDDDDEGVENERIKEKVSND